MPANTERKEQFALKGRLLIQADIRLLTGLHIGGTPVGIEIGGINNPIIRNPLTNRPYIPGSSLRGKMRSLLEKYENLHFTQAIQNIYIHGYNKQDGWTDVLRIFGVNSDVEEAEPTRLFVRDVVDLGYDGSTGDDYDDSRAIEVKWEASIDRVTSAAVPRQQERVSAGLVFRGAELVFNFYVEDDYRRFEKVLLGMRLLEDDYLGGSGSRGSGKIEFIRLRFVLKKVDIDNLDAYLGEGEKLLDKDYKTLDEVWSEKSRLFKRLEDQLKLK